MALICLPFGSHYIVATQFNAKKRQTEYCFGEMAGNTNKSGFCVAVNPRTWYCNVPLGEKYLGNMLAMLSAKYRLSQRYTNHCLRVTSLQVLDDKNVDSRHIIRVSGHKNTDSVINYARHLSAAKKRKISSICSTSVGEKENYFPTVRESVCDRETINRASLVDNHDDALDKLLSRIPQAFLAPQQNQAFNMVPRVFAPVLNNCNGVTFNVNILK